MQNEWRGRLEYLPRNFPGIGPNRKEPLINETVSQQQVTQILELISEDQATFDELIPLVYEDLRRIGRAQRRRFNAAPTLQTTALVNEAFLRLRDNSSSRVIQNRLHLQRLAAVVMRQLILDYARRKFSAKRGGNLVHQELNDEIHGAEASDVGFVLELEQALKNLESEEPRMAEVIAARFYAGYTVDEIAAMLDISPKTVSRDLRRGKAWLALELKNH